MSEVDMCSEAEQSNERTGGTPEQILTFVMRYAVPQVKWKSTGGTPQKTRTSEGVDGRHTPEDRQRP